MPPPRLTGGCFTRSSRLPVSLSSNSSVSVRNHPVSRNERFAHKKCHIWPCCPGCWRFAPFHPPAPRLSGRYRWCRRDVLEELASRLPSFRCRVVAASSDKLPMPPGLLLLEKRFCVSFDTFYFLRVRFAGAYVHTILRTVASEYPLLDFGDI